MRDLVRQVEVMARNDGSPAMILGEPGTGKGWLAAHIHSESARALYPFAAVHCATEPRGEIGTELFGTTPSERDVGGLVATARGGTIFVDEVNALTPELQNILLRVLYADPRDPGPPADSATPRFIVAANRDLVSEVNGARFREDLYYQLSAAPLHIPPLRARPREDLVELITATFNSLAMSISDSPLAIGDGVIDSLIGYPWPGNIRELRNAMERAIVGARGAGVLRRIHLPEWLGEFDTTHDHTPRTITDVERAHIHRTLRAHNSNRTHAARELGISRATLIKKIKEYGLMQRVPDEV
jgi:DNA-binding NtrC family response regulator